MQNLRKQLHPPVNIFGVVDKSAARCICRRLPGFMVIDGDLCYSVKASYQEVYTGMRQELFRY